MNYIKSKELLSKSISLYKRKEEYKSIPLTIERAFNAIKGDTFKQQITEIRACYNENNKELANEIKGKLNAVTFSATFSQRRRASDYDIYNSLIVLDIDELNSIDEMNRVESVLLKDEHVFAYWVSPSGKGYKGIVPIECSMPNPELTPHYHKSCFKVLYHYFKENYSIKLDTSGSDLSRLCFLTYCPELVIKEQSAVFYIDLKQSAELIIEEEILNKFKPTNYKVTTTFSEVFIKKREYEDIQLYRNIMGKLLRFLTKKNSSITETYEDWVKVAYAIANTFPYEVGERYFLQLCKLDGNKHDEAKSNNLMLSAYSESLLNTDFGTIRYLAEQKGFKYTPKTR